MDAHYGSQAFANFQFSLDGPLARPSDMTLYSIADRRERPIGSTRACSRCCPSAIWCWRSGCPTHQFAARASRRASACTWFATHTSRTGSTRR
jgi:hypothetical protein